jgi:hypothetical protein
MEIKFIWDYVNVSSDLIPIWETKFREDLRTEIKENYNKITVQFLNYDHTSLSGDILDDSGNKIRTFSGQISDKNETTYTICE